MERIFRTCMAVARSAMDLACTQRLDGHNQPRSASRRANHRGHALGGKRVGNVCRSRTRCHERRYARGCSGYSRRRGQIPCSGCEPGNGGRNLARRRPGLRVASMAQAESGDDSVRSPMRSRFRPESFSFSCGFGSWPRRSVGGFYKRGCQVKTRYPSQGGFVFLGIQPLPASPT
jgi:hypothetical protein